MENPKSYELTTINDILKVPADKIMECMMELGAGFMAMKLLLQENPDAEYALPDTHTWIDDNKGDVGFNLINIKTDEKMAEVRVLPEPHVEMFPSAEGKSQKEDDMKH